MRFMEGMILMRFMSAGDCFTMSTATSNTMAACCRSEAQE